MFVSTSNKNKFHVPIFTKSSQSHDSQQTPVFSSPKHAFLNKDNSPYSHAICGGNSFRAVQHKKNRYQGGEGASGGGDLGVGEHQNKGVSLSSRKAEQQQKGMQHTADFGNNDNAIIQITQDVKKMLRLIQKKKGFEGKSQMKTHQLQKSSTQSDKPHITTLSQIKQLMKNQNINKGHQQRGPGSSSSVKQNQEVKILESDSNRNSYRVGSKGQGNGGHGAKMQGEQIVIHKKTIERQGSFGSICHCENYYDQIILQYKQMVEILFRKIVKKEKNNRLMKSQLATSSAEISAFIDQIKQYEQEIYQKENKINELQLQLTEHEIKQEQYNEIKQKIERREVELRILREEYEGLMRESLEKQKQIEELVQENQALGREKEEIKATKAKYEAEITNFEEMEKLVQEKLIKVKNEIDFYKKERDESLMKIYILQKQLKQYKNNEEKRESYFGSKKNIEIQVNQEQLQICYEEINESYKNKEIQYEQQSITKKENQQKVSWKDKKSLEIQCYEQSMKILEAENNRLKNLVLKLHGNQQQQKQAVINLQQNDEQKSFPLQTSPIKQKQNPTQQHQLEECKEKLKEVNKD